MIDALGFDRAEEMTALLASVELTFGSSIDAGVAPPRSLHYAWIMAAVTFIILLGASGFRSAPGVLIVPLQDDFGWSRATISIAISINLLLFGFMGPFAAALMERFGIRTVVTSALVVIAAGPR